MISSDFSNGIQIKVEILGYKFEAFTVILKCELEYLDYIARLNKFGTIYSLRFE